MDATILIVVGIYFAISMGLGFWVARGERNVADDYFLAGRKLPWYAVSLSMTGSNIGTEHFIGMVGTAYVFGLAPATYEWGNFIPYSVLLWIFLPFFFRKRLYTIPEFLERRYNHSTRTAFALLTLLHMVVGVLIPALYAGGRILYELPSGEMLAEFNWLFMGCVGIIALVTAAYCIYGGLLSVVWTDVLQVTILVIGGLTLTLVGAHEAGGFAAVIKTNLAADPQRLSLILDAQHPVSPWTGVATFWFTLSLWYVGTNQFYIQRCLGAKSEWDAKMGVIGCGMLKIFLPLIIVFPGLIAFAKFGPKAVSGLEPDAVYVSMIRQFLSADGVLGSLGPAAQGLLLAALIAAIMSTVSSVLNSASTIWSIDIYQRMINSAASEAQLVKMGRWSSLIIILIGTAAAPLMLYWKDGIFIFIQNIGALIAPPIVVIFLAAFLWRRAHGRAATITLAFGIVAGALLWGGTEALWISPTIDRQDPVVIGRLAEDPKAQQHLGDDALTEKWLAQDAVVTDHFAKKRLAACLPFLDEAAVDKTFWAIVFAKPPLNRAAITWALSLVVMVLSTLLLPSDPHERYDPDAIWNPRWARLPSNEAELNRGVRNLMLWWLVMIAASGSLFAIFW